MMIENSLLLPDPSPIITIQICEECNGKGIIDTGEGIEECGDCGGTGEVEIWR